MENRIVLLSDAPAYPEVDAVVEGEFQSEPAARVDPDAEVSLRPSRMDSSWGSRSRLFAMSLIADRVDL